MANRWDEADTLDEGFTWDGDVWWNHATALANYTRPEITGETLPADTYLRHASDNLDVVEGWITAHPETEFDIFFPPYSILFWDKTARLGETEAVFAALDLACERLLQYDNVRLYNFLMDPDIVLDLDNYCDYVHHSGAVCTQVLAKMAAGECRMTEENYRDTLAQWRDFVVDYDYEKYWDESFWIVWNAQKAQQP